jgi:hypothetical protein
LLTEYKIPFPPNQQESKVVSNTFACAGGFNMHFAIYLLYLANPISIQGIPV